MTENKRKSRTKNQNPRTNIPKNLETAVSEIKSVEQLESLKRMIANQERQLKAAKQTTIEMNLGKFVYKFRSSILDGNITPELLSGMKSILSDGEVKSEPENLIPPNEER